jgi:predicted N-acetyltransferase YhbS
MGASGCVVLGDPGYYGRFGFKAGDGLVFPGVPAEYFQALSFNYKYAHNILARAPLPRFINKGRRYGAWIE